MTAWGEWLTACRERVTAPGERLTAPGERLTAWRDRVAAWRDRAMAWRDRLTASPESITRRRARLERNGRAGRLRRVDLRPGYRERALPGVPGGALACAWIRVSPPGEWRETRVLPDACVDLVWRAGGGALLAGPDTRPALVAGGSGAVIVGVRFAPGAGGAALGLALEAVRDARVPIADLWPALDRELPGDLEPRDALARLVLLGTGLSAARRPDAAMREAARRLADPRARVDHLAGDLSLSERQLRRRCRAAVGYGPKTLQRVLRFQRFLHAAEVPDAETDLAALAAGTGYADQAHLTRESTRLAGLPPAALLRARAAGPS